MRLTFHALRLVIAPDKLPPEEFRRKTFVLLGKAYTSISVSLTQHYLGLPIDQILSGMRVHRRCCVFLLITRCSRLDQWMGV